MRADFAHDAGVSDVTMSFGWNVVPVYGSEGVRTGYSGQLWVSFGAADALAQASKFICVRCVPRGFVIWVAAEVPVFQELSRGFIEDRRCNVRVVITCRECGERVRRS